MTMASPSLSPNHPLLAELASLRQQLGQYQKSSHQSASQAQAIRHELMAVKDANRALRARQSALENELEVLRKNPAPVPIPPSSTALTELSLAHRRLSAKLDLTEAALGSTQLELAASKQEIQRLVRDRDADLRALNEVRRVELEKEEALEWERGERRRVEEQKKLCDLALKEYSALVHSLNPYAVPPPTPRSPSPNILQSPPDLSSPTSASVDSPPVTPHSSADSISNLLIGQRGVRQLCNDFSSTLFAKEKELQTVQLRVDELEQTVTTLREQLNAETALRVTAQEDRAKALRDDGSAAKVVERYMIFTQKTHATIHLHLDNLRVRSAATQASLRSELNEIRQRFQDEVKRTDQLRVALDEMGEGFSRESAGRRREIGLRLSLLAEEEKRERKLEAWLDRVRKMRDGAEGAVIEPDMLETLLDEGVDAVSEPSASKQVKKKRSWRGLMSGKGKQKAIPLTQDTAVDNSVARVLLAEELAQTLNADLQKETERRLQLENERVEWLARQATNGIAPDAHGEHGEEGGIVFSLEEDVEALRKNSEEGIDLLSPTSTEPPLRTPSPLPDPSPLIDHLKELFDPLTSQFTPLQLDLHSLSHSLSSIRSSLPSASSSSPVSPTRPLFGDKKSTKLKLALRPSPFSDPVLLNILDSIHEVIEDARVDVEIALADQERVYRGFEALLGVEKSGAIQGKNVLSDAKEYLEEQEAKGTMYKLQKRVEDTEADITMIKTQLHRLEGMEVAEEDLSETDEEGERRSRSVWSTLHYRTVTPTIPKPFPLLQSSFLSDQSGQSDNDPRRRGTGLFSGMGSVGRSFSSTIVGAPRRVGGLASGLAGRSNVSTANPSPETRPEELPLVDDVE
ncbi:hypothetical protein BD324DRAFT_654716 [Kockovaella imperatae]|uniref:Uncharacterized protein n=1 Tax=Kockovaella imperatae TaxID=4999 RepID=A0A1Y1UT22_9TREE|nr:hypothetical protein BD324DRAFT_654716 [Kockovaella imperatae]ORX41163.1 hypothetical protein BD324DRAFT_654716 [Kockovaella imperatae]